MSVVVERGISGVPLENARFDTKMIDICYKIKLDNGTTGEVVAMQLYGHKLVYCRRKWE